MKKFSPLLYLIAAIIITAGIIIINPFPKTLQPENLSTSVLSDINSHDYKEAIEFISSRDIVQGYSDGTYKPDNTINRAELLKVVLESNLETDYLKTFSSQNCFSDVPANSWYTKYVCAAKEEGIVQGYEDGTFRPERAVSFVEALKIMTIAYGLPYPESSGAWYKESVNDASEKQIIPPDTIAFDQSFTRGQMAEMLTRFIKFNEDTLDEYLEEDENSLTFEDIEIRESNIDLTLSSDSTDQITVTPNLNIPPRQLIPYVSKDECKNRICGIGADGIIEELCADEYSDLTNVDREEIYDLFMALEKLNGNAYSDQTKYLTAHLIFSLLPTEDSPTISSLLIAFPKIFTAHAETFGEGHLDEFMAQIEADITRIKGDCPAEGFENYSFTAMCSVHDFYKENSIYSKQYAEMGGPCMTNNAGAIEFYQPNMITLNYMSSKNDFINGIASSDQISCSFSCGSYNCPKYTDEEAARKGCNNAIYVPFLAYDSINKIPAKVMLEEYGNMATECELRGDGCKLNKDSCDFTTRQYEGRDYESVLWSCCCSCAPDNEDFSNSDYDFSQTDYRGDDLLEDLLELIDTNPPVDQSDDNNVDVWIPGGDAVVIIDATALCGGETCSANETCCNSTCVNTNADEENCGSCDVTCDTSNGYSCQSGNCECADGLTSCDGVCVDLDTDENNCGECDNVCYSDETCTDGACEQDTANSVTVQFDCTLENIYYSEFSAWENYIDYDTFAIDPITYEKTYRVIDPDLHTESAGVTSGICTGVEGNTLPICQDPITNEAILTTHLATYKTYSFDDYTIEEINADVNALWSNMVYYQPCL
ncbi:MAG: S-layer homology domain-containing protein [Nitrospirota bacterium]